MTPDGTPLATLLRGIVAESGPVTVERFMALALGHPVHGYYRFRDPLGAAGDFTTAPEISQMFGELLGLWAAETWTRMGAPARVVLCELGPGRGTLMADALRAAAILPAFRRAVSVHLVETSPVLRERQDATLAAADAAPTWHERLDTVPDGPAIVLANEFFDALPVRQLVRGPAGWHERVIGLDGDGRLAFGAAPDPEPGPAAPDGTILEVAPVAASLARDLAARVARDGGAALVIDYGHVRSGFGDTLQAVRRHSPVPPLDWVGEADLTAHVDFAALSRAFRDGGAATHGPVDQGHFLLRLGLVARAERLGRDASPETRAGLEHAARRLAGTGDGEMGALFKVVAAAHPALTDVPGFG